LLAGAGWGCMVGGMKPRILAPPSCPPVYHVTSRVVDRRLVFDLEERERFTELMKSLSLFCGVELLAWCLMGNHFHLLLEVPRHDPAALSDTAFLARLRALLPKAQMREWGGRFAAAGPEQRRQMREPFEQRMGSLAIFMQLLKQRFTLWFNGRHERRGTLWESRYHSVLVDAESSVLQVVAAYIDLNPARAGLVSDPKDWAWCGYGAALGGDRFAKRALGRLLACQGEATAAALARYRVFLFELGDERRLEPGRTPANRKGLAAGQVREVRRSVGRLGLGEALRLRVAYFTRGGVIGRRAYVEGYFKAERGRFPPGRTDGARPWRGIAAGDLWSLRDLRASPPGAVP
jgi:putative transposase